MVKLHGNLSQRYWASIRGCSQVNSKFCGRNSFKGGRNLDAALNSVSLPFSNSCACKLGL